MKLIVGLGNPGKQYEKTRHNVGFLVVDMLRDRWQDTMNADWQLNKKFNGMVAGFVVKGDKVLLLKPMTYMNESGQSVQLIASYYNIPSRDIIVVHDDKDIPLGEIKIQTNRGHGGHNGVRSIIERTGTKDFDRVRVGVASKNEKKMRNMSSFVLGKFGFFEKKDAHAVMDQAALEIEKLIHGNS